MYTFYEHNPTTFIILDGFIFIYLGPELSTDRTHNVFVDIVYRPTYFQLLGFVFFFFKWQTPWIYFMDT